MAFSQLDQIRLWAQQRGINYDGLPADQKNRLNYAYQYANQSLDNTNFLDGGAYVLPGLANGDEQPQPPTQVSVLNYLLNDYDQGTPQDLINRGANFDRQYLDAVNERIGWGYNPNTDYSVNADAIATGVPVKTPEIASGATPATNPPPAPGVDYVRPSAANAYPDYILPQAYQSAEYVQPATNAYINAMAAQADPAQAVNAATIGKIDPSEFGSATARAAQLAAFNQLAGGDYARLEKAIYDSTTAPLKQQEQTWRTTADEGLAKRGIWASGIAARNQNDITDKLADVYAKAASDAVAQRYGLEQADYTAKNNYQLAQGQIEQQANNAQASIDAARISQLINAEANRLSQNANLLNNAAQFNASAANERSLANAQMQQQANLANAQGQNAFNLANTQNQNQFNLTNSQNANAFNLAAATAANAYNSGMWNDTTRLAQDQAGAANQFNLQNAQNQLQSQWLPWQYIAGLYGGTGGQVSTGSSTNANIGIGSLGSG